MSVALSQQKEAAVDDHGFFGVHPGFEGLLLLFLFTFFPRSTLFFAWVFGMVGSGLLAFFGWLIVPHVLIAILATIKYVDTNPVLVIAAWVVALAGTGGEGYVIRRI